MALVTIAGVEIKTPSEYTALTADIVDSGRNVEGYVVSDVIRYDVAKIEMSWKYLTKEEWSAILKLFNPAYGGAFINTVTYFDQAACDWRTRNMYVSDRTGGLVSLSENGSPRGWSGCSLSLVEV